MVNGLSFHQTLTYTYLLRTNKTNPLSMLPYLSNTWFPQLTLHIYLIQASYPHWILQRRGESLWSTSEDANFFASLAGQQIIICPGITMCASKVERFKWAHASRKETIFRQSYCSFWSKSTLFLGISYCSWKNCNG